IVRAGIETIHKGQIEAGKALGLKPMQVFSYIVIFPALKAIYPALTSQFILLMLTSSVVSAISAEELTAIANNLQSQTFRSFEIYLVVTGMYLAMSLMFSGVFALIYRMVFAPTDVAR
ncbi:MAG: ABC transporter permease, partial [Rhizobiales bacterium 12-66-7]